MANSTQQKKVIIVTGASSGIGKATALQLIGEGHIVYGAARRADKMKELVALGGKALKLDVMDHEAIKAVVDQVISEQGRIDVLVNNAGYAIYGAVEDTTYADALRQFEVNIFGLAEITKAVLPHMRNQKSGKIINVSSVGGKIYTPLGAWYHATKHALEGWSDCLRIEVKQFGIDVVVIEPGAIDTEFGDVMVQPMVKRSGRGAYKPMVDSMQKMMERMGDRRSGSKPAVIADLMSKAIRAPKPKTRYVAGSLARPLMFIRRWFSDRVYDRVIMSMVR